MECTPAAVTVHMTAEYVFCNLAFRHGFLVVNGYPNGHSKTWEWGSLGSHLDATQVGQLMRQRLLLELVTAATAK